MASVHLLLPLMVSCSVAASARAPRHLPPCQVVQMDVFCSDRRLRSSPPDLPLAVQMLDLSHNQLQNLTQETLAFRTSFHHLNLHGNQIRFIQPGLFRNMRDLQVLDLSRNHLNVFALADVHVGPLTAVRSLDLSGNGLYTGMSDHFLSDSPSLETLSLGSNSITKIARDTFSGAASLARIDLHNNVILDIEDGAFDSLDCLTELNLSRNSIACITDFNLSNLKVLDLSQNSVEMFRSAGSAQPFQLARLDLSENKMSDFPLLPRNNVLEYLDVSRNQLQTVNVTGSRERTVALRHLRHLDGSYNRLRSLPEDFLHCVGALEALNLSSNCLQSFSVGDRRLLQRLKTIDLSYNSLESLAFGEDTLPSLEELFLQGNDLSVLDHQIFQGRPSIRHLNLRHNHLDVCVSVHQQEDCVSFRSVPTLRILDLSENRLRTLPADAFADSPLEALDLSLNPGLDMDAHSLSGLGRSLVRLLLRENNISRVSADLSSLRSLKHVDLSTNRLTSLPAWSRESSIESLDLRNNNLVTLALEPSLRTLYVGSNPLSCCSNLGVLDMVQHAAVVVPDLETVTCVHGEASEPLSIERVTRAMCHGGTVQNYVIAAVLAALLVVTALVLLLRRRRSGKRKRLKRSPADRRLVVTSHNSLDVEPVAHWVLNM
ncbi:transforming growth factor beta activator LRRC32 [Brachionichthys hirsutus]|uniref:transforming growth factor beta activator LRRC32 n=1 Tax=Brachionichthys hirsutus TaxID=412623 RepID=UPI003604E904